MLRLGWWLGCIPISYGILSDDKYADEDDPSGCGRRLTWRAGSIGRIVVMRGCVERSVTCAGVMVIRLHWSASRRGVASIVCSIIALRLLMRLIAPLLITALVRNWWLVLLRWRRAIIISLGGRRAIS